MRRDFLKLCGMAGLGFAVPFRLPEARAAEKKDVDGVFGAAGDLDTACENCHLTFWYPEQENLFKKK